VRQLRSNQRMFLNAWMETELDEIRPGESGEVAMLETLNLFSFSRTSGVAGPLVMRGENPPSEAGYRFVSPICFAR
jgi:hypothetical protein